MKVSIEIAGQVVFSHPDLDELNPASESDCARIDLDLYTVPAVIRKVLKTTKVKEQVQVKCSRKDKMID